MMMRTLLFIAAANSAVVDWLHEFVACVHVCEWMCNSAVVEGRLLGP